MLDPGGFGQFGCLEHITLVNVDKGLGRPGNRASRPQATEEDIMAGEKVSVVLEFLKVHGMLNQIGLIGPGILEGTTADDGNGTKVT